MILQIHQGINKIRSNDVVLPPVLYHVQNNIREEDRGVVRWQYVAQESVNVREILAKCVFPQLLQTRPEEFPSYLAKFTLDLWHSVHVNAERTAPYYVNSEYAGHFSYIYAFPFRYQLFHIFLENIRTVEN